MRTILLTILTLFSTLAFSQALEEAREVSSIVVEFRDISQEGAVRVKDCNRCSHKLYTFTSSLEVIKNNQPGNIEILAQEYWDVKLATLFIKPNTNELLRIAYRK